MEGQAWRSMDRHGQDRQEEWTLAAPGCAHTHDIFACIHTYVRRQELHGFPPHTPLHAYTHTPDGERQRHTYAIPHTHLCMHTHIRQAAVAAPGCKQEDGPQSLDVSLSLPRPLPPSLLPPPFPPISLSLSLCISGRPKMGLRTLNMCKNRFGVLHVHAS